MMNLLRGKLYKQCAVYWKKIGSDSYGQPTYDEPCQIACRWEDRAEQYLDRAGRELISRSIICTMIDIVEGSALLLGTLDEVTDTANPFNNLDENGYLQAWEVKRFDRTPTLSARQVHRVAYL